MPHARAAIRDVVGSVTSTPQVFASQWLETFGRVVVEVQANGIPVVAADVTGMYARSQGNQQEMSDRVFGVFRPLRALAKRIGPASLKRAAWNAEYRRGKHLHLVWSGTPSSVCALVERYARGGDILDLGCGDGQVGLGLMPQAYGDYTGVDVSAVAVDAARRRVRELGGVRCERNSFVAADVGGFVPAKLMDVILFKDSLYYFTKVKLPAVLEHYRRFLKPGGVFIVQMNDLRRHGWIRSLIRERFLVVEDVENVREDFVTLVFR